MFKLLRIHQYIKNIFVFAPFFFSFHFELNNLINLTIVFVLFSLLASSIYVLNDYMDIEEDKQHPKKRFRPLASGKVE
ncbi:UbiA family prenyltransferase [Aliarcobacter cryaerophilus]|uniref:UbiA family prenyltransferase n=1 Tax=Aliarcobacter cryaerophilus TaxID=28198 RepID=UPI0021B2720E|nr:UbiA family prenyltransferase [Aliarcobacter cryaerophilus]MCT7484798.1 UbiA family prenyltransferase [Aliarcobacter cryaerophilus]